MESCESVRPQFCIGIVHFFEAFITPRYNSFNKELSLGNAFGLCQFAELPVDGFYYVGGVDYLSYLRGDT